MAQLLWTHECEIGINQIDQEHRYLLQMINRITALARSGRINNMEVWQARLNSYAASHFMHEEVLMELTIPEWSGRSRHIREHRNYWVWVAELDIYTDPKAMVDFLESWWIGHILSMDKAMGRAIQSRGMHHEGMGPQ